MVKVNLKVGADKLFKLDFDPSVAGDFVNPKIVGVILAWSLLFVRNGIFCDRLPLTG